MNSNDTFIIEKVLQSKGNKALVKWADYDTPTWELISAIPKVCYHHHHHHHHHIKNNKEKMEGSQHVIGLSDMSAVSISNFSLPDNYLQLRINSNDTYSKTIHPNNNCHDFTIEFEQPAAKLLQYRINQCNHYQVISAHVPIRSTLGVALQLTSNTFLASPVLVSFSPVTTTAANMPLLYRSKLGLLDEASYKAIHEDLHSMHISIHSDSLAKDINHSKYKQVYTLKTPPMIAGHHPSTPQVNLLYNK